MLTTEQIKALAAEEEAVLVDSTYSPELKTMALVRFFPVHDREDAKQIRAWLDTFASAKNTEACSCVSNPMVGNLETEAGKFYAVSHRLSKGREPVGVYQDLVLVKTSLADPVEGLVKQAVQAMGRSYAMSWTLTYTYPSLDPDYVATVDLLNKTALLALAPTPAPAVEDESDYSVAYWKYLDSGWQDSEVTGLPSFYVRFRRATEPDDFTTQPAAGFDPAYPTLAGGPVQGTYYNWTMRYTSLTHTVGKFYYNQTAMPGVYWDGSALPPQWVLSGIGLRDTVNGGLNELTGLYDYWIYDSSIDVLGDVFTWTTRGTKFWKYVMSYGRVTSSSEWQYQYAHSRIYTDTEAKAINYATNGQLTGGTANSAYVKQNWGQVLDGLWYGSYAVQSEVVT